MLNYWSKFIIISFIIACLTIPPDLRKEVGQAGSACPIFAPLHSDGSRCWTCALPQVCLIEKTLLLL